MNDFVLYFIFPLVTLYLLLFFVKRLLFDRSNDTLIIKLEEENIMYKILVSSSKVDIYKHFNNKLEEKRHEIYKLKKENEVLKKELRKYVIGDRK